MMLDWFKNIKIGLIRMEYIAKYIIAVVGINVIFALNIHPIWVIDENAIIDFIFVCVIPVVPPTITLNSEMIIVSFNIIDDINENIKIVSGANFWTDLKIKHDHHEIDVITDGNHMWHGTIPSFIIIDAIISIDVISGRL